MTRHRIWIAASTAVLAVALGWNASVATAPARPVDWVKLNPAFAGATFVKDPEACRTCHEDAMDTFAGTKHAHAAGVASMARTGDCESCHGPRSKHIEDPTAELAITKADAQSKVCLQCHEGGARFAWKAGPHQSADVSCTSCHTVMEKKSDRALLMKSTGRETCSSCHADVKGELNKMSHHPVREGRMECASCHNVHGSTASLLLKSTVTDTCVTCHTEKRGPFVWEHAPVRESCANCHTPHGSNQRNLLNGKDAFLCLSCHSYGGHINLPRYNRVSNPYGSGCTNCHITTHGSNHPSGAKFTR
jgi:DmsE family decaheme c-type cytochrome